MILRLNGEVRVDNMRNYPGEIVEKLRALLKTGAEAQADQQRQGFYDVANGSRMYFIHISPVSGKVMLLASWLKEQAQQAA